MNLKKTIKKIQSFLAEDDWAIVEKICMFTFLYLIILYMLFIIQSITICG